MHCKLAFVSESDVGKSRNTNQDSLGFDPQGHYFALADGMGGHNGGEVASAMAVHLCLEGLEKLANSDDSANNLTSKMLELIESVNLAIFDASKDNPALQGMGSTIVIALQVDSVLHYCHVGDSRLYLLRDGLLQPLTQDHSLRQEMIDNHPEDMQTIQRDVPSNIVTQALGVALTLKPSYGQLKLEDNDLLLASSDGLHGAMDHWTLEELTRGKQDLSLLAQALVECANRLDGSDNISVLLARVKLDENVINQLWRQLGQLFTNRNNI
ncbi:protein phosphatase 2C domain-containing protein [Gammaproteobacteria bacterium AS21]